MSDAPILYHCPQSRGGTTLWMNEELGAPCDVKLIDIRKNEQKSDGYLKINPMGKLPALTHDGVAVTEAAAICAYLADAFDAGLAPHRSDPKRGAYYRWMFFAPSCIEPAMLDKFSNTEHPNPGSIGHGRVDDVLTAIDRALENGPYLLGDTFTTADLVFGSTLNFALMFGAFDKKPAYVDYVERLMSRPAAQRADEKNAGFMSELGWA